jgi:uncharacterized membrane protein YraQ (UPF0718 family)
MKITKIPNAWKFLLVVTALYICVFFFNPDFIRAVLVDLVATLKKVLPIMGVVFFVMFVLNLFLKPEAIKKHLGKESGTKGWAYTLVGSIFLAGPPYILMPMIADFRKHGMKVSLAATFLSNRNVQPVFLPVMAYYFGWPYTFLLSALIIIFSVISGLIIGRLIKE